MYSLKLKKSETEIDFSEINEDSKGIIFVYSSNKLVGYLHYNYGSGTWFFEDCIATNMNDVICEDTLIDLYNTFVTEYPDEKIRFEFIEFNEF